jgi:hypothetical protein
MAIFQRQSVTRPADTTAYAAGDIVGGLLTFNGMNQVAGATVIIDTATLHISEHVATAGQIDLLLFDAAPTVAADNAQCTITDAQFAANYLGKISFVTCTNAVLGDAYSVNPALNIKLAATSQTLYAVPVAVNAYAPATNSTVLTVTLAGRTPGR